jgi:hypothetical protein
MIGKALAAFAAGTGLVVGAPLFVVAAAMGDAQPEPSAAAAEDIPARFLELYRGTVSEQCPTLPWSVLAAVGKIESNHGRIGEGELQPDGRIDPPIIGIALDGTRGTARILDTDGGRLDGDAVFDRAVGPMQFIPGTWRSYGIDASRDGIADPHNAIDATWSAARYLCALGADDPSRVPDAIWSYNHSWEYVEEVLAQASAYATAAVGIQPASPTLIAMVLANPRLDIYEAGREDIAAGRIDARVLQVLQLGSQTYALSISILQTGHSRCLAGTAGDECRVSHHWHGRAVDISAVNGVPVSSDNAAAMQLAEWLGRLPLGLLPAEVGSPWRGLTPPQIHFSDAAHADHLHAGWRYHSSS